MINTKGDNLDNTLEAYEHNLKLYNDSIRKDLDILLTSTIPTQKNVMKTILWLNTSVFALCIAALSKKIGIIYIAIPFFFSSFAIFIILLALKDGRIKSFGTPHIKDIENINQNKYEKTSGLITMNNSFTEARNTNMQLVEKRASKIALSINCTIISMSSIFILVVLFVNIHLMKGG